MENKIMQVFYGNDCLPYKDKERQIHYPIVGSAFLGASNTTKIRFYFDRIGNSNVTWVAVAKLPNGKQGSKVLSVSEDSELDENYVELQLDSWFTQAKGDVYIALQGYQGGVEYSYDSETELYEITGTPTIQTTGSIKLAINYAPIGQVADYTDEFTTYQEILAGLGDKADITSTIIVVNDITQQQASNYENGQVFYNLADRKLYQLDNSSFVVFQPYVAISTEPIPQSDFDIILAHKEYPILYGSYVFWYYGEDTLALRYARNDLDVSSNTFTTTKQQLIIFKNTREYDLFTQNVETYNKSKIDTELSGKQDTLVSGVNIATINHLSLLDNTNIDIQGGSGGGAWGEITGDIQDQTDLQNEFQNVREVAEGKSKTLVLSYSQTAPTSDLPATMYHKEDGTRFTDLADFNAYVSGYTLANSSFNSQDNSILIFNYYVITSDDYVLRLPYIYANFKKGDIFLITQTDVPDRWISTPISDRTYFSKLETAKVDLTNYATKTELADKSDLSNLAPEYDYSIGYAVGDKVIYGSKLYTCNTPITTPETWNSAHWTQVSVASGFVDLDKTQVISGNKNHTGALQKNGVDVATTDQLGLIDYGTIDANTSQTIIDAIYEYGGKFKIGNDTIYRFARTSITNASDTLSIRVATTGQGGNLAIGVGGFNNDHSGYIFNRLIWSGVAHSNILDTVDTYKLKVTNTITDGTNSATVSQITNGIFNVINASDITNNTLTQAQYDLITNGKPTLISGTLLGYNNLFVLNMNTYTNGCFGNAICYKSGEEYKTFVLGIQISSSNVISITNTNYYNYCYYNNVASVNGKLLPSYPSNTGTFTLKCVDGVLTWVAD